MENEYGCPARVYDALRAERTPLLRAVRTLGPGRVRWLDGKTPVAARHYNLPTAWELDGARANENELLNAADCHEPASTPRWRDRDAQARRQVPDRAELV